MYIYVYIHSKEVTRNYDIDTNSAMSLRQSSVKSLHKIN